MTDKTSAGATSKLGVRVLESAGLGRVASPDRAGSGAIRRQFSAPTSPSWGGASSSSFRLLRPEVVSLSCLAPARLAGDVPFASGSKTSPFPAQFPGAETSSMVASLDMRRSGANLRGREEEAVVYPGREALQHANLERCSCGNTPADGQCHGDRPQASRSAQSLTPQRFRSIRSPKVMASAPTLPRRSGAETERVISASARPISGHGPGEATPQSSIHSSTVCGHKVTESPPPPLRMEVESEATKSFIEQCVRMTIGERLNEALAALENRLLQRLEAVQQDSQEQLVQGMTELRQRLDVQAQQHNNIFTPLSQRMERLDGFVETITAAQVSTDSTLESLRNCMDDLQEKVSTVRCALSEEMSDRLAGEKASAQGLEQISTAALKEAQARAKSNAVIEETIAEERLARGQEISAIHMQLSQVQQLLEKAAECQPEVGCTSSQSEEGCAVQAQRCGVLDYAHGETPELDRLADAVNEHKVCLEQEKLAWSTWRQQITERIEELQTALTHEASDREAGDTRIEQACIVLKAAFKEERFAQQDRLQEVEDKIEANAAHVQSLVHEDGARSCEGLADMLEDLDAQMNDLRGAIEGLIASEGQGRREMAWRLQELQHHSEAQREELSEQFRGETRKLTTLTLAVSREAKEERMSREACDIEVNERLKALEEVVEDACDLFKDNSKAEPMKPRGSRIVGVDAAAQLRNTRTLASVECL